MLACRERFPLSEIFLSHWSSSRHGRGRKGSSECNTTILPTWFLSTRVACAGSSVCLGQLQDAVDDLAQDAFVVAYERIETLQHPEEAGPWLRSIARNLVRNELRKSMRRRRIVDIRLTEAMLAESDEPIAMDGDAGGA